MGEMLQPLKPDTKKTLPTAKWIEVHPRARRFFVSYKQIVKMLFIFLVSSLALVMVYAVLSWTIIPRIRQARSYARLEQKGAEAEAVILSIERTGRYVNNEPLVKMLLKVQPASRRNFVAEINEVLTLMDLSSLRAGSIMRVRYNPSDTREVMLVRK